MLRLPPSHAVRNLWRRPIASLLTIIGIAAVVFSATAIAALARGVETRLEATGDPRNLLMISRKGQSTIFSSIESDEIVHLGQDKTRIAEAERAGVKSVPALVIAGQPYHINFGAELAALK